MQPECFAIPRLLRSNNLLRLCCSSRLYNLRHLPKKFDLLGIKADRDKEKPVAMKAGKKNTCIKKDPAMKARKMVMKARMMPRS